MTVGEFTAFEHGVVGLAYLTIGMTGSMLTFFMILTFIREKGLFKHGRAWLHISLAIGNLGVVGAFPFSGSSSFSGRWLYGSGMCQIYAFIGMFFGIAAIGSIFAICVERYVVAKRADSAERVSNYFYWMITGMVWINAFFWAIMPVLGWSSYDLEPSGTSCTIKWQNYDSSYPSYLAMLSLVCFMLPIFVAMSCLIMASPATEDHNAETTTFFTESQLKMICVCVLLMALVGWGPYCFVCFWTLFFDSNNISMLAAVISPLAAKAMVLMYPLPYCVVNKRYQRAFMSLFTLTDKPKEQ